MRRSLSLRRTLVLGIVGLVAVVTIAIGVFSMVTLHNELLSRLDKQLLAATDRSVGRFDPDQGPPDAIGPHQGDAMTAPQPGTEILRIPGQREGTIAGVYRSGTVTSAQLIASDGELRSLTASELSDLSAAQSNGEPQSLRIGELGEYRIIIRSPENKVSQSPEPANDAGNAQPALIMALPLDETYTTIAQLSTFVSAAGLIGIVIAGTVGTLFVRAALRPLDRIAATATKVTEIPLDQGNVKLLFRVDPNDANPRTEVGQVGQALNVLLEHVTQALAARQLSEEKLRQFVADASHELRTPLAAIRGYAELTRRSPEVLPEGANRSVARIEAESIRMTRLVEDLLLLARLDAGTEFLEEHVDLTRLMRDAVCDISVVGTDHTWSFATEIAPVCVHGDSMRLHQVAMNLLNNARVHTPPGTAVHVTLSQGEHDVSVRIHDDGPGIDQAIAETLFERFVRGDSSRARSTGSTGLGLSIAEAIARSHRGSLSVESQPGDTTFTLQLPRSRT